MSKDLVHDGYASWWNGDITTLCGADVSGRQGLEGQILRRVHQLPHLQKDPQGQQVIRKEPIVMSKQSRQDRKRAIAEYWNAMDELERISKRDRYESDDYLAANKRVAEAEKHVSWWRR